MKKSGNKKKKQKQPQPQAKVKSQLLLSRSSAYERYKATTRAFRDGLVRLSGMRLNSVKDLASAVEVVSKCSERRIEKTMLDHLAETIELRDMVGATYVEEMETDDGHRYIIKVLKYCQKVLQEAWKLQRQQKWQQRKTKQIAVSGFPGDVNCSPSSKNKASRFEALQDDSDIDDEESLSTIEHDGEVIQPPDEPDKEYSIEKDLILGSLAFQANLFFLTAEKLFSIVVEAYDNLEVQMNMLQNNSDKHGYKTLNHQMTAEILKASAAVNMAIENAGYLEKSFTMESSKLSGFHRIFAVLVFQDKITEMEKIIGPSNARQNPDLALDFASFSVRVGQEGSNNYLCPLYRKKLGDFFAKCKLTSQELEELHEIGLSICASSDFEGGHVCLFVDNIEAIGENTLLEAREKKVREKETSLKRLQKYKLLGGRFGIMFTLSNLVRPPSEKLVEKTSGGYFDADFVAQVSAYMTWWYKNKKIKTLPGVTAGACSFSSCVPFLRDFDNMMVANGRVDFTTAFGFHAMFYSLSALKNNHKRVSVLSHLAVQKYKAQIDEFVNSSFYCQRSHNHADIEKLRFLETFLSISPEHTQAVWNPLLGGSFLLTTVFYGNISQGLEQTDKWMQARTILHLYNAMRKRGLIEKVDFLETLDKLFFSSKNIWKTRPTQKGEFLESFFLSGGDTSRIAKQCVEFLRIKDERIIDEKFYATSKYISGRVLLLPKERQRVILRTRHLHVLRWKHHSLGTKVVILTPLELSQSLRYFAYKEFPAFESKTVRLTEELGETCRHQTQLVQQSFTEDDEMMSFNWLRVAVLLDDFVGKVFDTLGIWSLIEDYRELCGDNGVTKEGNRLEEFFGRDIGNKFLADMVFRELDLEDCHACVNSKKVAGIMKEYFTTVATSETVSFY